MYENYIRQFGKSVLSEAIDKGELEETVVEIFPKCFIDTNIFVVDFKTFPGRISYHNPYTSPKLFCLSKLTGSEVHFDNEASFLSFINKSQISNIDKAFLYLLLFRNEVYGLATDVKDFSSKIYKKSALIDKYPRPLICPPHFQLPSPISYRKIAEDAYNSSSNNIVLYIIKRVEDKSVTFKYAFYFYKGSLKTVTINGWYVLLGNGAQNGW